MLRNLIRREICSLMSESVASYSKEINSLAFEITKKVGEDIYHSISIDGEIRSPHLYFRRIREAVKDPSIYPSLQKFIEANHVRIAVYSFVGKSLGQYLSSSAVSGEYDSERNSIDIFIHPDFMKEIFALYEAGNLPDPFSIATNIYYRGTTSTLAHELQHAFDDFRTEGSIFKSRQWKDFSGKGYASIHFDKNKISDQEKDERERQYVNLPHEVNAAVTQALEKVRFYSADYNTKTVKMTPLLAVIDSFKTNTERWRYFSEDTKRRVVSKISAYWHKAQENLPAERERRFGQKSEL